jgi:hypothetical protein
VKGIDKRVFDNECAVWNYENYTALLFSTYLLLKVRYRYNNIKK